jgi:hypothetical protein
LEEACQQLQGVMMNAEDHRIEDYLIKAFARYVDLPRIIYHFREQFGRNPTEDEIAKCNLGEFIGDKRAVFDPKNSRMRKFLKERELYENSKSNVAIFSSKWRLEKLDMIYNYLEPEAKETNNWGRCLEVLTMAAKEAMGGYKPNQNVNIDNRTINMNMSDSEVDRRIKDIIQGITGLDINLPEMPLVDRSGRTIEHDPE